MSEGPVGGVMAALKAAAVAFDDLSRQGVPAADFAGLAQMCRRATAELEAMVEGQAAIRERTREAASPSAIFRGGFDYGAMSQLYAMIPEDKRPADWGDKPPPPPTWEDAWAIFRTELARAK